MSDTERRLKDALEPVLAMSDPRPRISAYHDMPYAIFLYPPEEEFEVRAQLRLLETRLSQKGKRVTRISLAECLTEALEREAPVAQLGDAERTVGVDEAVRTVHEVLATYAPLVDLVAKRMPAKPDPLRDVVFIVRTGALFGLYRTFTLVEQLRGRVDVPAALFYPGTMDPPAGLKPMGVGDAEHNYRPKIF